jgi:alcohol dehydrogenase class IV
MAAGAFAHCLPGLHHAICDVLSSAYGLPLDETHAVVLPHAVDATPRHGDARVARALGARAGTPAAAALAALARRLGAPQTLRELGLRAEVLPEAVRLVAELVPGYPWHFLEPVLAAAWSGDRPSVGLGAVA